MTVSPGSVLLDEFSERRITKYSGHSHPQRIPHKAFPRAADTSKIEILPP